MINTIELNTIKKIALDAAEVVMQIYKKDFDVEYKDDNSPLTEADTKANEIICNSLVELYPNIPIMSEENIQIPYSKRKKWEYYWCIDPIDGTKEFVKKNGEFTINIALIHKGIPVLGVVYAPAIDEMYEAKEGIGAFKNGTKLPIYENKQKEKIMKVLASKSHLNQDTQEFIDTLDTQEIQLLQKGSSLKLCMVASGEADIYPRFAPTMEWDTAAADAIVRQSQKMTYDAKTNKALMYNKENLLNPSFIVK